MQSIGWVHDTSLPEPHMASIPCHSLLGCLQIVGIVTEVGPEVTGFKVSGMPGVNVRCNVLAPQRLPPRDTPRAAPLPTFVQNPS